MRESVNVTYSFLFIFPAFFYLQYYIHSPHSLDLITIFFFEKECRGSSQLLIPLPSKIISHYLRSLTHYLRIIAVYISVVKLVYIALPLPCT